VGQQIAEFLSIHAAFSDPQDSFGEHWYRHEQYRARSGFTCDVIGTTLGQRMKAWSADAHIVDRVESCTGAQDLLGLVPWDGAGIMLGCRY
jgi:hypothetical protein